MEIVVKMPQTGDGSTHTDNVLCASLCSKHAQYAGSASNVQHSFSLEKVGIVDDRSSIRSSSDRVLEHLLVDPCALY